jgi:hypothetical protein
VCLILPPAAPAWGKKAGTCAFISASLWARLCLFAVLLRDLTECEVQVLFQSVAAAEEMRLNGGAKIRFFGQPWQVSMTVQKNQAMFRYQYSM